ncbi:TPA: hypothetical protein VVE56_001435 [Streptococcus pneumoniae]|uniref:hypothetical protein n=1 Tax=Streptococcus pneumoniae TaxID=1313 RepID=UPI00044AA4E8|nr:hypothetical protein [Streptococcus pneumoniae]KAA01610.1 hypothetical protein SP1UMMC_06225 [Streptococcus pneumoniae DAR831]KAA03586.1 hypothetical protein SP2UMMC_03000 [Streptococcus pneumoniae DAR3264]KYA89455.1 hypothetical protein AKI91_02460 [Streptococcus pneumoniae]MBW5042254.1 hypothetical protein [Streptococcus pneumoniae]QIQ00629.1 hypothetical protein HA248_10110 [Streptococcus pneumoniae]
MEFQVRVSSECMYYFSLLEEIYSKEFTGIVTRGMILSKAFEETKHLNNWLEINNDTLTIPLHNIEYSKGYGVKIKAEINENVDRGIRNLKIELPKYLPVRSVTIGVTVKLICKAAILLRTDEKFRQNETMSISEIFESLEKNLKKIVAPINYDNLQDILSDSKNEIQRSVK